MRDNTRSMNEKLKIGSKTIHIEQEEGDIEPVIEITDQITGTVTEVTIYVEEYKALLFTMAQLYLREDHDDEAIPEKISGAEDTMMYVISVLEKHFNFDIEAVRFFIEEVRKQAELDHNEFISQISTTHPSNTLGESPTPSDDTSHL